MKRYLVFILILIVSCIFISCYTSEDKKILQSECKKLRNEKNYLEHHISSLKETAIRYQKEVDDIYKERKALRNNREPKYIVKFRIKQGTFTLDPFEHIKNSMNAIEVELPVSKEFYNRLKIGQNITDAFKWGSLVINGDFSELHMKVINKRIE